MDFKKIIKSKEKRLKIAGWFRFIPSKLYLKIIYRIKAGRKLNLKKPVTFTDKLNWLKLHDVHPEYTQLVDKLAVREYIKEKLGEDKCFPVLGVWKSYEDIDFSSLPNQFVLKCTHDSGSVKIIRDKTKINHEELKRFYKEKLNRNPYYTGREYPYKNVKPMIIAEKYMVPSGASDIEDYKFFCFNGKPEIMFVATDRSVDCKFDFYDMDFNHLDIENIHPQSGKCIEKPETFEEMKQIAAKLSEGIKVVRIDLYEIQGKIYFGEFTFFHGGGFWPFKPEEWERKLGDLITID